MEHKKKLNLLSKKQFTGFVILFICMVFLVFGTTSYADELEFNYTMLNDLTVNEWYQIFDYIINNSGSSTVKNSWGRISEADRIAYLTSMKDSINGFITNNPSLNVNLHHLLFCFESSSGLSILITQQDDNIDVSPPDSLNNMLIKFETNNSSSGSTFNYGSGTSFIKSKFLYIFFNTAYFSVSLKDGYTSSIGYFPFNYNYLSTVGEYQYIQTPYLFGFTYGDLKPSLFTSTNNASSIVRYNLNNIKMNVKGYSPEPVDPSGDSSGDNSSNNSGLGNITTPSGDNGGNINLLPIEQGISNLTNQISGDSQRIIDNQTQNTQQIISTISGETQKITNILTESADDTINDTVITSGDIANTVDFSPINDSQEYTAITNFWYELLNSFSNALTNVNRSINIEFMGQTYTINLDDFTLNVPTPLKVFLAAFTTSLVVIYISKNIKHIIEDIQTASIDNVASKLTEDFETNLF